MGREAQNFGSMVAVAATQIGGRGSANPTAEYQQSERYDQAGRSKPMTQIPPVLLFAPVARNGFGSPFPDSIVDRDGADSENRTARTWIAKAMAAKRHDCRFTCSNTKVRFSIAEPAIQNGMTRPYCGKGGAQANARFARLLV
jgi:hypothetical protein